MNDRDLAFDLAATLSPSADGEVDLLGGPRDLERWLEARGIDEAGLVLRLADFRDLRAAIRVLFAAAAQGRRLPPDAVEAVNAATAAAPASVRLRVEASDVRLVEEATASGAARVFAAIARDAIEILAGSDGGRLRSCPAPACGRFFVLGRAGQVWCSPSCGNRVRVARHHARRRTGSPGPAPRLRA
jgi:predicted RNA-binding Zn ribbon-like protein